MRKVVLSDSDFAMFDHEIGQEDYDFYQRHKDAYRRMWNEQGERYWVRFIMTFRSFTVHHGIIKNFPGKPEKYDTFVDQAFIYIHEQLVGGKFSSAKKFITDVFIVGTNRHTIQYMESKSYAKDPFYNKETRDVFRSFFGPATEKSSYIKVYFLMPIYLRLAGSLFNCLRRWLDAVDIGDGEDESLWWTPPNPCKTSSGRRMSEIRAKLMADLHNVKIPQPSDEMIENWWKLEEKDSSSKGPKCVPYWSYGDPRTIDEDNPLYNPESMKSESSWRVAIDFDKYKNFVLYAHRYLNPMNETEADLYHLSDSGVAVFYPQLPGQEERPFDPLQLQAVESFKDVLKQHADGEWSHGLPRAAHINREHGKQQVVLFDYKLKPNAKKSIKGTVLDSFAMNNRLTPECETCGNGTTLTPVVLSPCNGTDSPGKKKGKKNRKKKKNPNALMDSEEINGLCDGSGDHADEHNKVVDMTCVTCGHHHSETPHSCQPKRTKKHVLVRKPLKGGDGNEFSLKMVGNQSPQCSTLTIQKGGGDSYKRTVTSGGSNSNITTVCYGNEPIPVQPESVENKSYLPELINSFVATSKDDEQTKVQYNAETNHLVIRREPKKEESSDEEIASSADAGTGQVLADSAMKDLASKLQQMNYVDKIAKPKTHKVQIVKDDENIDKKNKKDSLNIRFTFNNKAADGDVDALSETKKSFTQEVASIVKTNMGDQPQTLPRNLENMVKQECRKSSARERLRKKHEMKKQNTSGQPSSLDSLDEGPSPTNEKTVEFPDSSVAQDHNSKGKGRAKTQNAPYSVKMQSTSDRKGTKITGNSKTEQLMNEKLAEFGIKPAKNVPQNVLKVAEKMLPFQSDGASSCKAKDKKPKIDAGKIPTPEGAVPTPDRLKYIQDLLKAEYKERYGQHHLCDDTQQTLIVGNSGSNVQIVIPTKKTPAQIKSQLGSNSRLSSAQASPATDLKGKEGVKCDVEESPKKKKLRSCANCGKVEPEPKTFKKCQRCRTEGVRKARYYCGRDCQVEDWGARHKEEHQENLL